MPTYFPTIESATTATTYYMTALGYPSTTLLITCTSLATVAQDFITPLYYPNNKTATAGNVTVVLTHTVSTMNITNSVVLIRTNSVGTILASGTTTAAQTNAATNTFTGVAEPSWVGASCSDRLVLRVNYINGAMSTQTSTLGTDRSTTYIYSTIPINGTGCTVLRNKIIISTS